MADCLNPPLPFRKQALERASVVEDAFWMQLSEMLLLCRLLFLGHDGRTEICLGGGDTAAELNVDADIAHRHFGPGKCAKNHEVVEIAEMADPEYLPATCDRPAPSDRL